MDRRETPAEPVVIMPVAEARRRYLLYVAMKLAGLAALFGGVFLVRGGHAAVGLPLMAVGAATMFIRPRMIGLTKGSRRP
ncbi:hypothetical protein [Polymorphobacter fuscus]|uniref:Uncharacterized protein n=1 Tax=Sandarakinorhabdus fusca TaxID=1439888 RepID=A0A7C9KK64_9SPHN|nr:hypothetical protein [Polymorphobacter fuscus]KAB7643862.1 hypothetical protein F9290_14990 [Polymorphobacter fuscus]MQT18559.1 hypothetical protein [Polymorphobacter fuscus]NJC07074.1 hypothetical protein [Polymorphobacter fuscus]